MTFFVTLQIETLVQSKSVVYKKNNCIVTLEFNYLHANQPAVRNNICEPGEKEKKKKSLKPNWDVTSRSHTALWPEGNRPLSLPAGTLEGPHPRVYPWCHANILKSSTCQQPVTTHLYWEHDTSDANSLPSSLTGPILRHIKQHWETITSMPPQVVEIT